MSPQTTLVAEARYLWYRKSSRTLLVVGPATVFVITAVQLFIRHKTYEADAMLGGLRNSAMVLVLLCVYFGASTFGTDAARQILPGQLIFEPRRTRLILARATAVFGDSAAIAAVTTAAVVVNCLFGTYYSHQSANWDGVVACAFRVIIGCGLAGLLGLSWSVICRSALVVVLGSWGLTFILEPVVSSFLGSWMPMYSLRRFTVGTRGLYSVDVSTSQALAVATAWTAASLVLAVVRFRNRTIE